MPVSTPFRLWQRANAKGKKVWQCQFINEDGKVYRNLALPAAKSRNQAAKLAGEALALGILPGDSNPALGEFLAGFWSEGSTFVQGKRARNKPCSTAYLYNTRQLVKRHLAPRLGDVHLADLTPGKVEKFLLDLLKTGLSGRMVNQVRQALTVAVGHHFKQLRQPSPLAGVEKVHEVTAERGILTSAEIAKLLTVPDTDPRIRAAVAVALFCGLRLGELRGLQWANVDLDAKLIKIVDNWQDADGETKLPKWQKIRTAPIPDPALEALRFLHTVHPGDGFVLPNQRTKGTPMTGAGIRHGFNRLLMSITISDLDRKARGIVFHSLRHGFVSMCQGEGIPEHVIRSMVGHSDEKMTARYTHATKVDFSEALAKLNAPSVKASDQSKVASVAGGAP